MKVAIFGVWHVHAGGYAERAMANGEVLGFYERDDGLAERFAKRFDIPRFATAEELLESEAEGVIVCSASCDHAEDIIRIARAGKHIFTEKVLALTDEDCDRVEAAVAESGVDFTIALFQKYIGSRLAVKQVVDSGELGQINYVRFRNCHSGSARNWLPRHFYDRGKCGGGAMIDLGAHGMYLIEWIMGEPIAAKSIFTHSCTDPAVAEKNVDGVEDNAVTILQYADGAIAVNETGFVSNVAPVVWEVHGVDGYVRMEGERIVKRTKATEGKEVEVAIGESLPHPLMQFLTGEPLEGCSMKEAKALTHMMTMAYAN